MVDAVLTEEAEDCESQETGRSPSSSSTLVKGGRAGGGVPARMDLEGEDVEIVCGARLRGLGDSPFSK